jgi:hypothetical protein
MQTNFTIFENIRKQLLNQGYHSIIILNKHEGPEECFLSKKDALPDIVLKTNYLLVPLTDSYAVEIIKKHFDDKTCIIRTFPSKEFLKSCKSIIDNDFFFEITEERWLHVYKRGEMIDTIDLCENTRRCYMNLKKFIEEDVIAKSYFSLPFGYTLMRYLQQVLPFEEFDLEEIFYNYEVEEAGFERSCFDMSIDYIPNLNRNEQIDYLEGATGKSLELPFNGCMDDFYYHCKVNLYYKMLQVGFIMTNPFGEIYETFKIDLNI